MGEVSDPVTIPLSPPETPPEFAVSFLDYLEMESERSSSFSNDALGSYDSPFKYTYIFFDSTTSEFTSEFNYPVKLEYPPSPQPPSLSFNNFRVRLLGVPAKSRVETQLKLCLQLVKEDGSSVTDWRSLTIPSILLGETKRTLMGLKDDQKDISPTLLLEASLLCATDPSKKVVRCFGCIQRERRMLHRKKKEVEDSYSVEEEQQKALQFYCNPILDFSTGEVIIPTRITCYCRHHDEKVGFQINVTLTDVQTSHVISSALSSPIIITDDHKTNPKGSNKRQRTTFQDETPLGKLYSSAYNAVRPLIEKVVPSEGPVTGGIEVTILGKHLSPPLRCLFGSSQALQVEFWGNQTLLCLLPPSSSPGPVSVTFEGVNNPDQTEVTFTYKDDTDRSMMELALQVVGMKMTGKVDDARQIALRIVNSANTDSSQQFQSDQSYYYHKSIEESILQCLKELSTDLMFRENLNLQNSRGQTLLMLAVIQGSHPLVRFLIGKGVQLNLQDKTGHTALHYAALRGYQGIVELLLSQKHRLNGALKTLGGRTALDYADLLQFSYLRHLLSSLTPEELHDTQRNSLDSKRPLHPLMKKHEELGRISLDSKRTTSHFDLVSLERNLPEKRRISLDLRRVAPPLPIEDDEELQKEFTKLFGFARLQKTISRFLLKYRLLLFVGLLLIIGGLFLGGMLPWQQGAEAPPSPMAPNSISSDPVGSHPVDREIPMGETPSSPSSENRWKSIGVLTFSFLVLSCFLGSLANEYQHIWKFRTVAAILLTFFASLLCLFLFF